MSTSQRADQADIKLIIRAQEASHEVIVPRSTTIRQLAQILCRGCLARTGAAPQALKLINAGRVLTELNYTLEDYGIDTGQHIHVAIHRSSERSAVRPVEALSPRAGDVAIPIAAPAAPSTRRGFDRLLDAGLDPSDVEALRQTYLPQVQQAFPPEVLPRLPGESEADRLFRMEEAWMRQQEALGARSEFQLNLRPYLQTRLMARTEAELRVADGAGAAGAGDGDGPGIAATEGTCTSFTLGFALGAFVGLMALVLYISPYSSRRLKNGVLLGCMFHAILSLAIGAPAVASDPYRAVEIPDGEYKPINR